MLLATIQTRYWALLGLLIWGGVILGFRMLRLDGYGLDEGGAMALLLGWSVSDQIANPIALYGSPDFRVLPFYLLLGLYWPGSMIAAKVLSLLVFYLGALCLFYWSREKDHTETALMATGLLLIAPGSLMQINALAVGPYLLLLFGAAHLLERKYRQSPHSISSWYFLQLLLVAFVVSLHPMGLAYPIALAWHWRTKPGDSENARQRARLVLIGSGMAVLVVLIMQAGWIDITWFSNPTLALNDALWAYTSLDSEHGWWLGTIALILLLTVMVRDHRQLRSDLFGSILALACVIGLLAADGAFATLALVLLLYRGIPQLIQLHRRLPGQSFASQRGILLLALIVLSAMFTQADKHIARAIESEILTPTDQLIASLATEASNAEIGFFAASQWPARTMMICRRDTYHLPPAGSNGEELYKSIHGVTHLIFDQNDPANRALAKNLSQISTLTETLAIADGGVIIRIRDPKNARGDTPTETKALPPSMVSDLPSEK